MFALRSLVAALVTLAGLGCAAEFAAAGPAPVDTGKALAFLDARAESWVDRKWSFVTGGTCALSCHTTVPYLLVRAAYGEADAPAAVKLRALVEARASHWDTTLPVYDFAKDASASNEAALAGPLLAFGELAAGKTELSPEILTSLERAVAAQMENGGWAWMNEYLAPLEDAGAYYWGSAFVSMLLAKVPATIAVKGLPQALDRAAAFLNDNFDQMNLHAQMQAARAGAARPALLAAQKRKAVVVQVLKNQNQDGGWTLAALGTWRTKAGVLNDPAALPSDGYATGLATLVLLENGVAPGAASLTHARAWLESHQAENGAWPLLSLNSPEAAFNNGVMTDASTSYALLALKALATAD